MKEFISYQISLGGFFTLFDQVSQFSLDYLSLQNHIFVSTLHAH